jgi:cell filamentation protein
LILEIRNAELLQDAEEGLSAQRLLELVAMPVLGNFDLEHIGRIHMYIFQDIYDSSAETP